MDGVHVLEQDIGVTGEDWIQLALTDIVNGLAARLESELRLDELDDVAGAGR